MRRATARPSSGWSGSRPSDESAPSDRPRWPRAHGDRQAGALLASALPAPRAPRRHPQRVRPGALPAGLRPAPRGRRPRHRAVLARTLCGGRRAAHRGALASRARADAGDAGGRGGELAVATELRDDGWDIESLGLGALVLADLPFDAYYVDDAREPGEPTRILQIRRWLFHRSAS